MDDTQRIQAEAAAFRRLVAHLRERTDVQNIDLMNLAGFCRNCLGDWYGEAAGLAKDEARAAIYGMPQAEWKAKYQTDASPEAAARFAASAPHHDTKGGGGKGW